ncbi:MAG: alpha-amylase family glycosyl hydrolase, partial [Rectinema subterraneum]|uniref:alpha-amylase family glycosyl hydrolase n=1 Tax=Rectinema subterraneum TaxID=2653714 RepID=UPI003C7ACEAB
NHTSPDSILVQEHPDWFLKGLDGKPGRKCEDWSDVVDFDYSASPHIWVELISTLARWRDRGVDGFRCDVASLVPADFWKQARMRVNQYDPGARKELSSLVWLAESVHPAFLRRMRSEGYGAWSEPELHAAAFDLTYDYDGWERLEVKKVKKRGQTPIFEYFEYLYAQETLYPKGAKKLRFLENHDQERAASRLGRGDRLKAWTVLYQFLPGIALAYMGQELALEHRPSLFDRDPIEPSQGDPYFERFFVSSLRATTEAKRKAPFFSWTILDDVAFCLRSATPAREMTPIEEALVESGNYLLIARAGEGGQGRTSAASRLLAPFDIRGTDLLSGEPADYPCGTEIPSSPALLVRLGD